jgi:membrane protein
MAVASHGYANMLAARLPSRVAVKESALIMQAMWNLVKDAVLECRENKAQRLAAALAYYVMCSLAPLLIVILAITGAVYGKATVEERLLLQLRAVVGPAGGEAIQTLLRSFRTDGSDLGTTVIGAAGLLFVASGLFNHVRDSLNTIWEVASRPGHPVRGYLFSRLLALTMVAGLGFVALVGSSLSIGVDAAARDLAMALPANISMLALRAAHLLLSFGTITVLVALIYKVLPDATIAWTDTWVGATATALLIVIGQALMGFYLRSGMVGSAFSIVGAIVIILAWVYYSALIFFFGAELTWLYANRFGSRIVPAPRALSLAAGDRAAQGLLRAAEIEAMAQQHETEN